MNFQREGGYGRPRQGWEVGEAPVSERGLRVDEEKPRCESITNGTEGSLPGVLSLRKVGPPGCWGR